MYIHIKIFINEPHQQKDIICFFLFRFILNAQDIKYEVREYSSREGLSQSVVNCVLQDSRGYIWAGTQDGLNKFDGYHFKVFKPDAEVPNSISQNHIWKIIEDSKNNLWIGTYGGGLNFYDYKADKFTRYQHFDSDYDLNSINGDDVRAIYEDNNGIMWVGTKNGLNSFDPSKNKWVDFSNGSGSILPYKNIRDIYPYSEKEIWLACYGSGLVLFNTETKKSVLYSNSKSDAHSISSNDVWEIIKDASGIYWVTTFGGGVNIFDSRNYIAMGKIKFKKFFNSQIDQDITSIFETEDGKILIGTDTQGLVVVDQSREHINHIKMNFQTPNTLTNNGVWSICKNNSGGYWLGTFGGGLNYLQFKNTGFEHITTNIGKPALNNPIVFCIKKINKDEYLAGTYGGGLNKINLFTGETKYFTEKNSSIASNYITDIVVENNASYWLGTDGGGVSRYNPGDNTFVNYNAANNKRLSNDFIKCMLIDSYKNIWVGTLQGLFNIQNSEKVLNGFYSDTAFQHDTRALLEIEPGKILIGTHGDGIFIHDVKKGTFEKLENKIIEHQQITALYRESNNILWIGTRGRGLIKYNFKNNTAIIFTEKNGLCNNTILGIERDKFGKLWIITNNGVSKFDSHGLLFTNYYVVDGLLSNEFVQGAIYKDERGIIYAGNIKGIEIIDPEKFTINEFNPLIDISKLTIMNQERSLSEISNSILELSYKENFIKIDFSSLDFSKPEKNLYRYKLTPGNPDWVFLGKDPTVNFANLTPDKYLLELNGTNSNGLWSSNIKRLSIIISPPFYNTYWFYSLLIFTIGFVIFRFHHVQTQKKLEMERLRLKIASDLHDDVGSSLTQISINADMINYEHDMTKIKTKSEIIRTKSSEMINIMNDVIWSIDSRNDSLESLIERIKITAGQFASSKEIKIDFDIRVENPNKKLNVDFRQNLFLIVKEAINNSVKYSEGSMIKLKIREQNESIKITISDNGNGLPYSLKKTGSGIKNMKHRMDDIKGKIEFINNGGLTINIEAKII